MKLDNEYLDKEKVGKLLDFTFLGIKSKADLTIGGFKLSVDKDKVELKELQLETTSDGYNPGYNRISLKIKRKECGFFRTRYEYEIDLSLSKGSSYDHIDISDTENTDKIGRIFDFLMDIDYQKKKRTTDEYIDTLIGDLDKTIGLAYKRDDKIDSLLDGK